MTTTFAPRPIYPANDWTEIAGPIRGLNSVTGVMDLYHGSVTCVISATSGVDTPIGALTTSCPEIGTTGKYGIQFEAAALTTALGALADGTLVYRVLTAATDFRVEDTLVVRKVRPSV